MAMLKLKTKGNEEREYKALPADTYYMKIRDCALTDSKFINKDTGEPDKQIQITWEISRLTEEQQEDPDVDAERWVKQWFGYFYGATKGGTAASKLKVFIDSLVAQGFLEDFDPETGDIDTDWFIGIEQKVSLTEDGSWNKVGTIMPIRKAKSAPALPKNAPQRIEQAPVKAAKAKPAPVAVVEPDEDEEELFDNELPF
jgi:hypothetical protein